MLAAQDVLDLHHRDRDRRLALDDDLELVDPVGPEQSELRRLQRNEDLLILVEPARPALFLQHSHDLEGDVPDRDRSADKFGGVGVQHRRNRASEHGDPSPAAILGFIEEASDLNRVVFDLRVVRRRTENPHARVVAPDLDLQLPLHLRSHLQQRGGSLRHRLDIFGRQPGVRSAPDAPEHPLPRANREHVGSERLDLVLDLLLGTLPEGHHRDHGPDPDHDPEHGQERAQLVGADRVHRDPENLEEDHRDIIAFLRRPAAPSGCGFGPGTPAAR